MINCLNESGPTDVKFLGGSEKEDIDEISEFRDRLDDLIDEGFEPDFEAGIWENIQQVDEHDLLAVPIDKL